jgi:hypothetical protein
VPSPTTPQVGLNALFTRLGPYDASSKIFTTPSGPTAIIAHSPVRQVPAVAGGAPATTTPGPALVDVYQWSSTTDQWRPAATGLGGSVDFGGLPLSPDPRSWYESNQRHSAGER